MGALRGRAGRAPVVAGSPGDGARAGVVGAVDIAGVAGEDGAVDIAGVAGKPNRASETYNRYITPPRPLGITRGLICWEPCAGGQGELL